MIKKIKDYGVMVTVKAAKNSYLFIDGIDRDRYISSIIKKTERVSNGEIIPIIAGLNNDCARIIFMGGDEDILRKLIRSIHISYSSYRKLKNCPVAFKKTTYETVDGFAKIKEAKENIKADFDFICYMELYVV